MIQLQNKPVQIQKGLPVPCQPQEGTREKTIAYSILREHNHGNQAGTFSIRFDSLISHDITYVGIIQTALASGLTRFPLPYVLTNCHNSLCAVGGTINADDHAFGLSAAKKYGGIYVPANMAVIHQFAREELSACGGMILGSDSHTRYGALGTMGVGEGGPELVKQLLRDTWDISAPEVILVWLTGAPPRGVGPHDVALALCGKVYRNNFVKNKILEFAGPGVAALPMDFRIGIDVMTTETACLSSIWITDEKTEEYYAIHHRPQAYHPLTLQEGARYDGLVEIDLSAVEPMAALPFHPSEAVPVRELRDNAPDYLDDIQRRVEEQYGGKVHMDLSLQKKQGCFRIDQGVIAGCAGGMYDNLAEAAAILSTAPQGCGAIELTVYPPSIPVQLELSRNGIGDALTQAGAILRSCFCGPCFGAGDVPPHNSLSARHTTRNFPNREGSRPGDGQISAVLLMDARSIAATAAHGGILTPATEIDYTPPAPAARTYDRGPYEKRLWYGWGRPEPEEPLRFGPNIVPWPKIPPLSRHLLLKLDSVIHDPVTTTDELIPSGETSSYRSNPVKLASFTLSRRDPDYVSRTQTTAEMERSRQEGKTDEDLLCALSLCGFHRGDLPEVHIGSAIFAEKPGDGSAREQAASCQRVLGGCANLCREFATKRYRSNCVNWGMLPFVLPEGCPFPWEPGDLVFLPNIRGAVASGAEQVDAYVLHAGRAEGLTLLLPGFTQEEREIVLAGCLMNWYAQRNASPQERAAFPMAPSET